MILSVLERLLVLNILPAEGDIITLKIVQQLRSDLSFSEAEVAQYQFKTNEGQVTWNTTGATDKDIPVGPKAFLLITEALEALNKSKKLKSEHIGLYDKFVGEKE